MRTRYHKDTTGVVKKILEELQQQGLIKYSHIDRIKARNPVTRNQVVVEDIYFVSTGLNGNKPLFVVGAMDTDKEPDIYYISHLDYTHINLSEAVATVRLGKYQFLTRAFCNPVTQYHIWERPQDMNHILKGNLMEGNPNDRWRRVSSVDMDKPLSALLYTNSSKLIPSKATLRQFATCCERIEDESIDTTRNYVKICKQLTDNPNLRYGYFYDGIDKIGSRLFLTVEEIETLPHIWKSDYYRIYSKDDIDAVPKIDREEISLGIFGCGSAGSAIADQARRLTYFQKCVLVDFDIVEKKNIRNQTYTDLDIGSYKTHALSTIMKECGSVNSFTTQKMKIFNSPFEEVVDLACFKFKYLVSGFDSFETRLELLNQIKQGKIKTKYLIDTRYRDLTSSLFFIDTENEDELEYYSQILLADKAEYREEVKPLPTEWTEEDVLKIFEKFSVLRGNCAATSIKFKMPTQCMTSGSCGTDDCKKCWLEKLNNYSPLKLHRLLDEEENSCLAQNYIHIYQLTASWVTSIIRDIETNGTKQLSHIELGIEPFPQTMIIRK